MRPGSIVSIPDSTNDAKRKPEIGLVCGPVEDVCRCRRVSLKEGLPPHGAQNVVSGSWAKRQSLQTLQDNFRERQNAQLCAITKNAGAVCLGDLYVKRVLTCCESVEELAGIIRQDKQHGD
eukprot:2788530-Pleurochrysis_carterae.AAC.2